MSKCQNCHNCEYKARIPGDTHISCEYPYFSAEDKHKYSLLAIANPPMLNELLKQNFGFTGDMHGIRAGWFTFPINFDPTWMNGECTKHSNILPKKYVEQQILLEKSLKKHSILTVGLKEGLIEDSEKVQETIAAYDDAMNYVRESTTENITDEERTFIRDNFVEKVKEANEIFDKNEMIEVIKKNQQLANACK